MDEVGDANDANAKYVLAGFPQLWSQWQLLDSILPTGGFAHSLGLEAAIQANLVIKSDDLKTYVIHVLENVGSLLLPFVYATTMSPDTQTWRRVDRLLNTMLTNEVGCKASTAQGSALMRVGLRRDPLSEDDEKRSFELWGYVIPPCSRLWARVRVCDNERHYTCCDETESGWTTGGICVAASGCSSG